MKQISDILGMVLPALIILLSLIRLFVKKTKGINGLIIFFALLLLVIGILNYFVFSNKKPSREKNLLDRVEVSKHSATFSEGVEQLLTAYFNLSNAFSQSDNSVIKKEATLLVEKINALPVDELQKDTLIYQIAQQPYENIIAVATTILNTTQLPNGRELFNNLSNELYIFMSTIRYDRMKLYWLECADAFGEGSSGNWLAKEEKAKNPFAIENCSELKTTIDYLPVKTNSPT